MAFTAQQQRLYNHLRASLPRFLFQASTSPQGGTSGEELWGAMTLLFDAVWTQIQYWVTNTRIKASEGIWLDQHAKDRGTARQEDETDAALIQRLTQIEDVITPVAILAGVQAIMTAFGATGTPFIIELRGSEYRAFFGIDTVSGGKAKTYFNRGFRLTSSDASAGFVVILPYPTSATVAHAVNEYLDRAKAGGMFHLLERATQAKYKIVARTGSYTLTGEPATLTVS